MVYHDVFVFTKVRCHLASCAETGPCSAQMWLVGPPVAFPPAGADGAQPSACVAHARLAPPAVALPRRCPVIWLDTQNMTNVFLKIIWKEHKLGYFPWVPLLLALRHLVLGFQSLSPPCCLHPFFFSSTEESGLSLFTRLSIKYYNPGKGQTVLQIEILQTYSRSFLARSALEILFPFFISPMKI